MRPVSAEEARIAIAYSGALFIALILTSAIDHYRIVCNGLFCIAIILRYVTTAKLWLDVNPAGKAIVLKDLNALGEVAEVQAIEMAVIERAVHAGDIAVTAPPK